MICTPLTQRLGLKHPIIQAPMALAAGGKLAAAVDSAGGLGLIGGGYGQSDWLEDQFRVAGNNMVGCGLSPGHWPNIAICWTRHWIIIPKLSCYPLATLHLLQAR